MSRTEARRPDFDRVSRSVQPDWMRRLPIQQQSVLFLATRGPDGVSKNHPCKDLQRAYRGSVFMAATRKRMLEFGERADTFMSMQEIADPDLWERVLKAFFDTVDSLPHHYTMHILHGAEILGYKHPDDRIRYAWQEFYMRGCYNLHLTPETEEEMDGRLNDWFGEEDQTDAAR